MKYDYREGVQKPVSRKRLIIPMILLLVIAYGIVDYLAPAILYVVNAPDTTAKRLVSERPKAGDNRLYIPKINADIAIEDDGAASAASPVSSGNGNPKEGGTYTLEADRYNLALTPSQTQEQSPFYHLGNLQKGDDIYVDYSGARYAYKIENVDSVSDTTESEGRTEEPTLVLYTRGGDSHQLVRAKQVGMIVWTSGQPKLRPLPAG